MDTADSGSPAGLADFNRNVTRWVNEQDISGTLRNTLRIIGYRADMVTWRHHWGIGTMAAYSRSVQARKLGITPLTRGTFQRHLNKLEKLGLVTRVNRAHPAGRKTTNEYLLHFDMLTIDGYPMAGYNFRTGEIPQFGNVSRSEEIPQFGNVSLPPETPDDTSSDLRFDTSLKRSIKTSNYQENYGSEQTSGEDDHAIVLCARCNKRHNYFVFCAQ